MKLRTRLALTLVSVSVPLIAVGHWLRTSVERSATVTSLAALARARMEAGGRVECEASPETFQDPPRRPGAPDRGHAEDRPVQREVSARPQTAHTYEIHERVTHRPRDEPPPPRLEMFAYSADFESANPAAPVFPAELRRALESGKRVAGSVHDAGERREVTAALRMSWTSGPCAIVLATRHDAVPSVHVIDEIQFAALLASGLVLAMVFAIGPVERRVRRLTEGVRRSAADGYRGAVGVDGRDEIGELAGAFNAAGEQVRVHIEELEKRERSLRDFVQNTTHDVMLPLTVLQGQLTAMREELDAGHPAQREAVREALEESHYLASLVQNLGAAARLETGPPALRRDAFSWNQVVERVMQRHAPIARQKQVALDFAVPEADVQALGDVTLVEQALSNVVHNAVRYNASGGHVALILDADTTRFSVRVFDDGPGVPDEDLTRISERSYRGDAARARHPGGLGLGLSIAKEVADRHGFALVLRRARAGGLEVEISGAACNRATRAESSSSSPRLP